ncbi:glycoside hydrolase family 97 protein [Belliella sp. R4-6]|uniref:Glycoside hydrolase family 97 protein n=1 Tax=Belliella alkalica TaxID=1730871 RepID=A0ABS9VE87_9BACT|nr:glycoside hydrolase family 97 protein [Belliella alkalica]MCH7414742.1 glycoside hydrolase family 97 protein [Belliella alkalica]
MNMIVLKIHFSTKSLILAVLFMCTFGCSQKEPQTSFSSPDSKTKVEINLEDGKLYYELFFDGEKVLESSQLGMVWENFDFSQGLELVSVSDAKKVKDSYDLIHGKQKSHEYNANETTIVLKNVAGNQFQVVLSVSDNGLAFKYVFPDLGQEQVALLEEKTTFNFKASAKAWIQPMADPKSGWEKTNPSYEESYQKGVSVGTPSPIASGWIYPALFQTEDTWLLLSETGIQPNHAASRLAPDSPNGEYRIIYPSEKERIFEGNVLPTASGEWESPWRILAIGSLKDIVESTLGTDLAIPQRSDLDFGFVIPGAASWSWALGKDESIYYDIQEKHIDYAADMNWEYCLVDVNWDTNIGYDKIGELAAYAESKSVGLLLWYNSAGDWNTTPYTPKSQLLTREMRMSEFQKIKDLGVKGVKIDFFGGDGQSVMQYYHDILEDAAKVGLIVNFHGATLPRGWHRTYPNLVTVEAVKGFEMITFEQEFADEAPRHMAILPFTRNVFDPMDFTPMSLHEIPGIERRSSKGFELALSVLFYSGVQHFAESPEGMALQDPQVKEFLKSLPSAWDEVKFVDGFPGDFAIMARRSGDSWYLAGINAQDSAKKVTLNFQELGITPKNATLISDADDQSWKVEDLANDEQVEFDMKANGGFVLYFKN